MNKLRVLIVDDSARTISLIKDSLSEDTEVEIVGQAENGVEAIEMIRETKPDVVFLDLSMPRITGNRETPEIHCRDSCYSRKCNAARFPIRCCILCIKAI